MYWIVVCIVTGLLHTIFFCTSTYFFNDKIVNGDKTLIDPVSMTWYLKEVEVVSDIVMSEGHI